MPPLPRMMVASAPRWAEYLPERDSGKPLQSKSLPPYWVGVALTPVASNSPRGATWRVMCEADCY